MDIVAQRDFGSDAGGFQLVRNLRVPMRDGALLATDVYLPSGTASLPALLHRTPYGRRDAGIEGFAHPVWYTRQGFAVVCQDTRGRWDSEGSFYPYRNEAEDGFDTIEWIAAQTWCDGSVGMYGYSYPGATQLLAASQAPPHLKAIAPGMTGSNYCDGWTYHNGALQLAFILAWTAELGVDTAVRAKDAAAAAQFVAMRSAPDKLFAHMPIRTAFPEPLLKHVPYFRDWLRHPAYDEYWQQWSPREHYETISHLPSLHIGGWYDIFLEGTLENFVALNKRSPGQHTLVVGPWGHTPWSRYWDDFDFGPDGKNIVDEVQVRFFKEWLVGSRSDMSGEEAVQLFIMGANRWTHRRAWPPECRILTLSLDSDGRANSNSGTGRLHTGSFPMEAGPDICPVDPAVPIVTQGGRSCCFPGLTPMGPADQRSQESRNDMLLYDSETLTEELLVIGQPIVRLFIGSEASVGDLVVRLTDVHEDGRSVNISDGHLRWSWEEPPSSAPIHEVMVALSPTAVQFMRGHRLRLQVSGSSFPLYDRSPHARVSSLDAGIADLQPALMALFHDARYPSQLDLPVCSDDR